MGKIGILILLFTAWLWDLGQAVLWMLCIRTSASSCWHGVGLSEASTEKSGGESRKLWEEFLSRNLASLKRRVFGLHKPAETEGTQCYEHADSQVTGTGCLLRGCIAFIPNLCRLNMDTSDFWQFSSNSAPALNSPAWASHCLSSTHVSCPAPDSAEAFHPAVIQLCCLPLPWLGHSSKLAPISHCHCVSSL